MLCMVHDYQILYLWECTILFTFEIKHLEFQRSVECFANSGVAHTSKYAKW